MKQSQNMNPENIIVGLDIGTTKICCIVAKKNENQKIEILGTGMVPSRGVRDGEVDNIQDTTEDIIAACQKAKDKTGIDFKEVFVGIAGAHIKSTQFTLGITRQNPEKLIDYEDIKALEEQIANLKTAPGEQIISYHAQEYYVDQKQPLRNKPIGMRGNRLEANWHVIKGNSNSTDNLVTSVEDAGYIPIGLDLEPLASAASVLTHEQMSEGVCLVDIGGGTTDIAIFHKGIIRHTAIFPYAGEYITSIIQDKMRLTYQTARKLKENQNYTSALFEHISDKKLLSVRNLDNLPPVHIPMRYYCRLVNACLEQIFGQVKKEIAYSNFGDKLNAGIVVTGGGAMIANLKPMVEQFIGLHTSIGMPTGRLSNLQDQAYSQTIFATSIGLALLAAEKSGSVVEEEPISSSRIKIEEEITPDISHNLYDDEVESIPKKNAAWLLNLAKTFKDFMLADEITSDFEDTHRK